MFFFGLRAESARAEENKHRGTEVTEKGCDLCLRALCVSNGLTKTWFCQAISRNYGISVVIESASLPISASMPTVFMHLGQCRGNIFGLCGIETPRRAAIIYAGKKHALRDKEIEVHSN